MKKPTTTSSEWQDWLKKHKHKVHEDGSVSVFEDVNLSGMKLTKLPFQFREVTGSFICSDNQLTSLQGAPQKVGGDCYCSNNQLTSLQGAPQKVGGTFNCYSNRVPVAELLKTRNRKKPEKKKRKQHPRGNQKVALSLPPNS